MYYVLYFNNSILSLNNIFCRFDLSEKYETLTCCSCFLSIIENLNTEFDTCAYEKLQSLAKMDNNKGKIVKEQCEYG